MYSMNHFLFKESCCVRMYMYMWMSWYLCVFIHLKENSLCILTKLVKTLTVVCHFGLELEKLRQEFPFSLILKQKGVVGLCVTCFFDVFVYFSRWTGFFFGQKAKRMMWGEEQDNHLPDYIRLLHVARCLLLDFKLEWSGLSSTTCEKLGEANVS